eukprot:518949-Hanusia_phi.AAC.1
MVTRHRGQQRGWASVEEQEGRRSWYEVLMACQGYKYWSCCKKKKTTEFSEFLSFAGCTEGTCVFQVLPGARGSGAGG